MARALSCPLCLSTHVRLLDRVSSQQSPDFYRCDSCAHVWWIPKSSHVSLDTPPPGEGDAQ